MEQQQLKTAALFIIGALVGALLVTGALFLTGASSQEYRILPSSQNDATVIFNSYPQEKAFTPPIQKTPPLPTQTYSTQPRDTQLSQAPPQIMNNYYTRYSPTYGYYRQRYPRSLYFSYPSYHPYSPVHAWPYPQTFPPSEKIYY